MKRSRQERKYVSLDPDLLEFIEEEARHNHRTMTGQISYMLEVYKQRICNETRFSGSNDQFNMPESSEERAAMVERIR